MKLTTLKDKIMSTVNQNVWDALHTDDKSHVLNKAGFEYSTTARLQGFDWKELGSLIQKEIIRMGPETDFYCSVSVLFMLDK